MNAQANWQELNARYLAAAMEWLRLKLAKAAPPVEPPAKPMPEKPRGWFARLFCKTPDRQPSVAIQTASSAPPSDEEIASAEHRMLQLEESTPSSALVTLGQRLGLSRFEQQVLLLCVAMELDTRMPYLCASAQDDARKPYPTFALAFSLFDEPAWDSLAPHRPLRYWQLIEINQPGATPLTSSALHADERIASYVKGLNNLDDRLRTLLVLLDGAGVARNDLSPSQHAVAKTLADSLVWYAQAQPTEAIQLVGPDSTSKHQVVWDALHHTSAVRYRRMRPYRLAEEQIPTQTGEFETFLRLWDRERRLLSIALYLELSDDSSSANTERSSAIRSLLSRARGLIFVDTRQIRPDLSASTLTFDIQKPAPKEQQDYWSAALGKGNSMLAARLAAQFNLNFQTITELVVQSAADEGDLSRRVWQACLTRTRPGLEKLAQRIDVKATWQQIVLPDEPEHLLRAITAQVGKRSQVYDDWGFRRLMNRGLGISALFAGESGTGKTMAAEVIANDLGLDLYRIDLSAVVSKYIGETEKNLRRVFDAAENGGAILFFDEADALFGKRSEVKDSHDRYANIEINYLLQRMEAFRGLAILATNRKSALDQAFLRRLRFIVDFPFPAATERAAIWECVFPEEVPRDPMDYDRLARFSLSGGSIHNIALNSAFLAAATPGGNVTMAHVLEATKAEFRKLDKPVNERDFHVLEAIGDKL